MEFQKILAGNWKMHKVRADVLQFFAGAASLKDSPIRNIVAPSTPLLQSAVDAAKETGLEIFAQNSASEDQGAFTGESSSLQLLDLGVKGSIIGHSERRTLFFENDENCAKRAAKALSNNLDVIYCVGETLEERDTGKTNEVLNKQLTALVNQCSAFKNTFKRTRLIVAYEPVWAIGTGRVASPQQVEEAHAFAAQLLEKKGLPCPILYGGSVKPSNFGELSRIPYVHGALVGGASLAIDEYLALHKILSQT